MTQNLTDILFHSLPQCALPASLFPAKWPLFLEGTHLIIAQMQALGQLGHIEFVAALPQVLWSHPTGSHSLSKKEIFLGRLAVSPLLGFLKDVGRLNGPSPIRLTASFDGTQQRLALRTQNPQIHGVQDFVFIKTSRNHMSFSARPASFVSCAAQIGRTRSVVHRGAAHEQCWNCCFSSSPWYKEANTSERPRTWSERRLTFLYCL